LNNVFVQANILVDPALGNLAVPKPAAAPALPQIHQAQGQYTRYLA
jgi:hypothetical protein